MTPMPAASNAAIFSAAVPERAGDDRARVAHPAPRGAVCPAMNPTTGFVMCCLHELGGLLLVRAADLAHHHDRLGVPDRPRTPRGSR